MTAHGATTVADLARYEIEIIPTLVNRIAVLSATDLTQPPAGGSGRHDGSPLRAARRCRSRSARPLLAE